MTSTAQDPDTALAQVILAAVVQVPASAEQALPDPASRARVITRRAAQKASLVASSMALPPGVWGWLTVVPELMAVWRIQSQLVADIAALYGQHASLRPEHMLYCLFRHVSAQLFRDVVVRLAERTVVRQASVRFIESLARQIGLRLSRVVIGKGASRLVPLLGALGVGTYAYFDTRQVAANAMQLFSGSTEP